MDLGDGRRALVTFEVRLRVCKGCGDRVEHFTLCDWKLTGPKEGKTCSAVSCARCSTNVGVDKDLCPPHARLWDKHPANPRNKASH
jgi:hypothetical protein